MIDYEKEFGRPGYAVGTRKMALSATFKRVYGWMSVGLLLSGIVAWMTATSGLSFAVLKGPALFVLVAVEIGLVLLISAGIRKLNPTAAILLFLLYAAVNGLTLSVVFICYKLATVTKVFFITAGMFGGLVAWGTMTKDDLSSVGSICGMALWGLIIASVVNLFFGSSQFDWIISLVGVFVFTGLTMYDAQKIKQLAAQEGTLDQASVTKLGILGALSLYLDFINLFLYVLRFFGRKD